MVAFYVCIIFLGILLVIASLFFIIMDRANGKDFFKEFDRKKDEMFTLIQDSEEMVQELNKMSDYVISMISEKNKEFINNYQSPVKQEKIAGINTDSLKALNNYKDENEILDSSSEETCGVIIPAPVMPDPVIPEAAASIEIVSQGMYEEDEHTVNTQITYNKDISDNKKSRLVLNSRRREVLEMIEQGLSNDEICDKLKIGKGEISLIRGLNK
jgi:hypothetical protein